MRLRDETGRLVKAGELEQGSFATVFPETAPGSADGQAVLVRVDPTSLRLPEDRADGAPDGYVCYSKVCTHLGCPIGLYLAQTHELRCPCHQSTFDVLNGAEPVYGPADRPLPQLLLEVDDEGYLTAKGDFTGPVGPGFWTIDKGPEGTGSGVEAVDERVGAASFLKRNLGKVFPDHWAFMLGEVALYAFVLLVLTGVFLTFFYVPSSREVTYDGPYAPLRGEQMSAAYDSVMRISYEVRAGLVMRQIHHWSALVFIAAISVHMLRVLFTGAFRKPRDINWTVGFSLLMLGKGAGFTGYSLPDDLLSGTGIRIGYSALLSIPVIGEWAAFLFFGGEYPAPEFLGRFYALHIMIIPGLLIGALTVHLMLVWRQKHTQFAGPGSSCSACSPRWGACSR
jgi:hypothetical protein